MINCTINGKKRSFDIDPLTRLREMLLMNGNFAVRDSDDAEGFCGSDTVLLDGTPVFSNLILAGEVEGCEIRTPDSLKISDDMFGSEEYKRYLLGVTAYDFCRKLAGKEV